MPCRLQVGPTQFAGMVIDLSRTGIFVQTSASAKPGQRIQLRLGEEGRNAFFTIGAEVVWKRKVPPQLVSVAEGGLGLRIENAPEEYFALLAEVARLSQPA